MKTREEIIASCPIGCDLDSYLHGYANGYTDGELEKPNTPEGLEEAADRFVQDRLDAAGHPGWNWETRDVSDAFIAGAKWQAAHTPLPEDTVLFQKGVEEGKRLMMMGAVDAIVEDWNSDPEPEITITLNPEEFTRGDKVRIIIVKEKENGQSD